MPIFTTILNNLSNAISSKYVQQDLIYKDHIKHIYNCTDSQKNSQLTMIKQSSSVQFTDNINILKSIKHPNVLSYIHDYLHQNTHVLILERCTPLCLFLDQKDNLKTVEYGLLCTLKGLVFLNKSKINNDVDIDSIYVDCKGNWKIGRFCSDNNTDIVNFIKNLASKYQIKSANRLVKDIQTKGVENALENSYFGDVSRLMDSMNNIVIYKEVEKEVLIEKIETNLNRFAKCTQNNLILEVAIGMILENSSKGCWRLVDKIAKANNGINNRISNFVCEILNSTNDDRKIMMLKRLSDYYTLFGEKDNHIVYVILKTQMVNPNPSIRELVLKVVILFVDLIDDKEINRLVLDYQKLQFDVVPAIRTNAIISISKLNTRIKNKENAALLLVKSLSDPFPPSRSSALIALQILVTNINNQKLITEIIIPKISVLLIDKEKTVRTPAYKTIEVIINKIKSLDSEIDDQQEEEDWNNSAWEVE